MHDPNDVNAPDTPVAATRRRYLYAAAPDKISVEEDREAELRRAFEGNLRGTPTLIIDQVIQIIKNESKFLWAVETHPDKRRVFTILGKMWLLTWRQIVEIVPGLSKCVVWDRDGNVVAVDYPVPCVAPQTPKDEEKPRPAVETDVSPFPLPRRRLPRDAEALILKNAAMIPAVRLRHHAYLQKVQDMKEISIADAVRLLKADEAKDEKKARRHRSKSEVCAQDFVTMHLAISATVLLCLLFGAWRMGTTDHRLMQCERALINQSTHSLSKAERADPHDTSMPSAEWKPIKPNGIEGWKLEKAPDVTTSTECDESGCRMKARMKVDQPPTVNNVPPNLRNCVFQSLEFNLHDDRLSKTFYMCEVDLRQFVVSPPGSVPSHLTNCELQSMVSPLGNGIAEFAYYLCS